MSSPNTPFYPMDHDDALDIIQAINEASGQYDTMSARSIVNAIRSGNGDKIPNGSIFKETHAVYGDIYFITRAHNQHKVAGDSTRPTITIESLYLLSTNGGTSAATFQYDRPEAFASVDEAIPANTVCKFTVVSTGGSWTAGDYHFTPTANIAAGSKLLISGNQDAALTSRKVQVFADGKASSASASYDIVSGDGDATLDLGSWDSTLNHRTRILYGSNNEEQSNFFQFLNGDSGSGYMSSIWQPKTKFDMMDTSFTSKKGFLGGFSDEFRSYLGLCAIPNVTNTVYETNGYTADGKAYSYNGYFFLPSRKEIYGSNETEYEAGETQFDYYATLGTTNADKLKYAQKASSPTTYWLRTPNASGAITVRICYRGSGGALYSGYASVACGAAPLAILA
ncbi:MAG: hypothetical protein IKR48_02675 [Kiritimatiellae bacterium]|nr:hypothetical protein [Kiritimatiellia bacterium]